MSSSPKLASGARAVFAALLLSTLLSSAASAQIARAGLTRTLFSGDFVLGPDVAYDPVNQVYLVLMPRENQHDAFGSLLGVFVDHLGIPAQPPFVIASDGRPAFTRATYSPTVSNGAGGFGGFLVTWSEPWGRTTGDPRSYSRIVAYPNRLVGTQQIISDRYAPREVAVAKDGVNFGVAYDYPGGVRGLRLDLAGAPTWAGPFPVPPAPFWIEAGDVAPSPVLWNQVSAIAAHTTQPIFAALYAARRSGTWFLRLARFQTAPTEPWLIAQDDVTPLDAPPAAVALRFNPATGNYIAIWADSGTGVINGAEISEAGRVLSLGVVSANLFAGQNGMALSYGPGSGTFLLLGYSGPGAVIGELRAIELNKHGAANSPVIDVTDLGLSTNLFAPRAGGRSTAAEWMVTVGGDNSVFVQVVSTSTLHGGSDLRLGGCATPDPFVVLGGGTCFGGGWLPPGIAIPGVAPPAPPTPPSSGGCITPDPFVALGGGTCHQGGWLPPGMPIPGAPPPPPPPPPPASGGCTTPDPFVALGGGTCHQGGWLPPGMPIPGAPPPLIPGGCTTPDPFAALGGGTCHQGGWLPPGMPIPGGPAPPPLVPGGCTTPDPFVALGGGTCFQGGWFPPGMPLPGGG